MLGDHPGHSPRITPQTSPRSPRLENEIDLEVSLGDPQARSHAGWVNRLLDESPHLAGHRLRPLSLAYAAELDPDGECTHGYRVRIQLYRVIPRIIGNISNLGNRLSVVLV